MDELIDYSEVAAVLADLAKDIEQGYKDTLLQDRHYTTLGSEQRLIDSVKTRVEVGEHSYEVVMDLNSYWKYLENGTAPHWPPREAILNWIRIKPVLPYPDSLGRRPSENQLAYLISRAMAGFSPNPNIKGGTKASHGLQRTKDSIIPMYAERLSAALGHDVERYIRKVLP